MTELTKSIKVSSELHKFLTVQALRKGESYDETIKRLLQDLWDVHIEAEKVEPSTMPDGG